MPNPQQGTTAYSQSQDEELDSLLPADIGGDLSDSLDLDSLLAESVQQAEDRKASKALLSRIRQGRASKAETAMAAAVELKAAWTPVAVCELWDQFCCECGHTHATFSQYMIEHKPAYQASSLGARWVKVEPEALPKGLKQKAIYNTKEVFHCSECSEPPAEAEVIIWTNGQPSLPAELEVEAETEAE